MNYILYVMTFPDGKYYVGITNSYTFRMYKHATQHKQGRVAKIDKAIEKFGFNNIRKTIIMEELTRNEAIVLEAAASKYLNSIDNGYNTLAGPTKGKYVSPETRLRMSKAQKGLKKPPGYGKRMSKARMGSSNPSAKEVIDIVNGFVFGCVGDAAEVYGHNRDTLRKKLRGQVKNNTNLRYVDEVAVCL